MNYYKLSSGERISKSIVDRKIRESKQQKIDSFIDEHGYIFCEDCKRNATDTYIDCSHDESVDSCQKNGRTEKAWDINNITMRCRFCHQKHD
jgi:hypothetical protein